MVIREFADYAFSNGASDLACDAVEWAYRTWYRRRVYVGEAEEPMLTDPQLAEALQSLGWELVHHCYVPHWRNVKFKRNRRKELCR